MFSVKLKSETLFKKASLANKETEPIYDASIRKKNVIEMLVRLGHIKAHDSA